MSLSIKRFEFAIKVKKKNQLYTEDVVKSIYNICIYCYGNQDVSDSLTPI